MRMRSKKPFLVLVVFIDPIDKFILGHSNYISQSDKDNSFFK